MLTLTLTLTLALALTLTGLLLAVHTRGAGRLAPGAPRTVRVPASNGPYVRTACFGTPGAAWFAPSAWAGDAASRFLLADGTTRFLVRKPQR